MAQGERHLCDRCGQETRADVVKSAFWERDRLVVVEDVPAQVCDTCMEQFYDENTIAQLDLLRGHGFSEDDASSLLQVPVFSLRKVRKPDP